MLKNNCLNKKSVSCLAILALSSTFLASPTWAMQDNDLNSPFDEKQSSSPRKSSEISQKNDMNDTTEDQLNKNTIQNETNSFQDEQEIPKETPNSINENEIIENNNIHTPAIPAQKI